MIQRIQSLYLLLAAIAGAATWYFPLWHATLTNGTQVEFHAPQSYLLFIVLMIIVALAAVSIFLYKNRKLQFRLTVLNVILAIAATALQYIKVQAEGNQLQANNLGPVTASYLPAAFLPIVITVLLLLAARGIYKDEKLIKSLDRLR
ncbi:DUF4293 domain-containing protein [Chitinophaga parva]|uniref:DUF4293 domain-containing protein n=1 Tax=Chitinophaga parva TaxID=2169414 RepID=A0A2T7BK71_9BACT|nr:DUF4293 domain-containing protein [Chitinophaga parva]PUZ28031.1 DUF4293 domain-containing protein [Chitinophaga parva]